MIFDQIRELFIFDFDDTLARNTGKVRVVKKNGTMLSLESSHFANYVEEKGDYFDFSDFFRDSFPALFLQKPTKSHP